MVDKISRYSGCPLPARTRNLFPSCSPLAACPPKLAAKDWPRAWLPCCKRATIKGICVTTAENRTDWNHTENLTQPRAMLSRATQRCENHNPAWPHARDQRRWTPHQQMSFSSNRPKPPFSTSKPASRPAIPHVAYTFSTFKSLLPRDCIAVCRWHIRHGGKRIGKGFRVKP